LVEIKRAIDILPFFVHPTPAYAVDFFPQDICNKDTLVFQGIVANTQEVISNLIGASTGRLEFMDWRRCWKVVSRNEIIGMFESNLREKVDLVSRMEVCRNIEAVGLRVYRGYAVSPFSWLLDSHIQIGSNFGDGPRYFSSDGGWDHVQKKGTYTDISHFRIRQLRQQDRLNCFLL
jgi:hypothetical protein